MTRLHVLHESGGQSPWLDNLRRDWLRNGEVARWVERGVRGITSNPAIFQKAFTATTAYEDQFRALVDDGRSTEDAYWDLVTADIVEACDLLEPLSSASGRADGQVSVEVSPSSGGLLSSSSPHAARADTRDNAKAARAARRANSRWRVSMEAPCRGGRSPTSIGGWQN